MVCQYVKHHEKYYIIYIFLILTKVLLLSMLFVGILKAALLNVILIHRELSRARRGRAVVFGSLSSLSKPFSIKKLKNTRLYVGKNGSGYEGLKKSLQLTLLWINDLDFYLQD